jgi:ferredoxin
MKIKLDRTICDGFGLCAKHAPEYFSLDDWGYASLVGNGDVPEQDREAVMRALLDCPVHAILKIGEYRQADGPTPSGADAVDEPHLKTEHNEAEWGFVR